MFIQNSTWRDPSHIKRIKSNLLLKVYLILLYFLSSLEVKSFAGPPRGPTQLFLSHDEGRKLSKSQGL